jgi:tetratricopeptide (TPR) repeat protein
VVSKSAVEAINKSPSPEMDSLLPLCWLRLGKLYFKVDQYPQAIAASEEAEKAYKRLNQLEGVARSHLQLAEVHRIRGNHSEATDLFTKAYEEFEVLGNSRDMSSCLRNLGIIHFENENYAEAVQAIMKAQDTCGPADLTCLIDCKRELGRVYREHNSSEAIKLLTDGRAHYLRYGPPFHAANCLYQKSIAHYLRRDYSQAERGLNQAYEEFKNLGNYAQMGFCIYHRAVLNGRRGLSLTELELFEESRRMFEEMENPRMVAFSFLGRARTSVALCRMDHAEEAYAQVLAWLEKPGDVARYKLEMQNVSNACNLEQRYPNFGWHVIPVAITVFCCLLFLRGMRRG